MEDKNYFAKVKNLLESSNSFIVALPPDPSLDLVSAGLSLHLSLRSAGKKSLVGCGSDIQVETKLKNIEEITTSIGAKNLIISFDYHEDNLEKVDYDVHVDGQFYLMIKPKAGAPIPDVSHVKYSYSGASADLVIVLGINSLEELGKIYADEKKFLDEAKILSLNITPREVSFTQNMLHLTTSSFSELVAHLLEKIDIKPTTESASNLLTTLYDETGSLTSPKMTADTFSAISFLMRHGGRLPHQQPLVPRFTQAPFFETPPSSTEEENIPLPPEENTPVPQDWTKPKIFRATD